MLSCAIGQPGRPRSTCSKGRPISWWLLPHQQMSSILACACTSICSCMRTSMQTHVSCHVAARRLLGGHDCLLPFPACALHADPVPMPPITLAPFPGHAVLLALNWQHEVARTRALGGMVLYHLIGLHFLWHAQFTGTFEKETCILPETRPDKWLALMAAVRASACKKAKRLRLPASATSTACFCLCVSTLPCYLLSL